MFVVQRKAHARKIDEQHTRHHKWAEAFSVKAKEMDNVQEQMLELQCKVAGQGATIARLMKLLRNREETIGMMQGRFRKLEARMEQVSPLFFAGFRQRLTAS